MAMTAAAAVTGSAATAANSDSAENWIKYFKLKLDCLNSPNELKMA